LPKRKFASSLVLFWARQFTHWGVLDYLTPTLQQCLHCQLTVTFGRLHMSQQLLQVVFSHPVAAGADPGAHFAVVWHKLLSPVPMLR
jgi:hypothetical protein